jgi:hypothetical protein
MDKFEERIERGTGWRENWGKNASGKPSRIYAHTNTKKEDQQRQCK